MVSAIANTLKVVLVLPEFLFDNLVLRINSQPILTGCGSEGQHPKQAGRQ